MAKYEKSFFGRLDDFVPYLDRAILSGSMTASVEDSTDVMAGDARVVVRVYERFAASTGSRVSLNITAVGWGSQIYVSAITSGGTEAMFTKIFTLGEDTFLDKAVQAIDAFGATGFERR